MAWKVVQRSGKEGIEEALEGYARVPVASLVRMQARAGTQGVFFARVRRQQPQAPPVMWIPRQPAESEL
eukprot:15468406-Alexandrium_andersonii.AAC.1